MNISNTILQIMGMEIAAKLVNTTVDCETKLWRAVINTALEDVMNPAEGRNSAVLKGAAHDWFCDNSEDFEFVCLNADLDPKYVRKRYLDALEKGIIYFTKRQNLNINYTKQYDKLRKAKTSDERKLINKNITKLREAIFKL